MWGWTELRLDSQLQLLTRRKGDDDLLHPNQPGLLIGRCLVAHRLLEAVCNTGVQRAANLKNRSTMDPSTVKRMKAYFDRHASNYQLDAGKSPKEDKGYVAGLLWGGEAGKSWANKVVRQMEAADQRGK
jgi:hypothetical protein